MGVAADIKGGNGISLTIVTSAKWCICCTKWMETLIIATDVCSLYKVLILDTG